MDNELGNEIGNTGVGRSAAYGLSPTELEFDEATGPFNAIFYPNLNVSDQVTDQVADQVTGHRKGYKNAQLHLGRNDTIISESVVRSDSPEQPHQFKSLK